MINLIGAILKLVATIFGVFIDSSKLKAQDKLRFRQYFREMQDRWTGLSNQVKRSAQQQRTDLGTEKNQD